MKFYGALSLQEGVDIETEVVGPGPNDDFLPSEDNPKSNVEDAFRRFMMGRKATVQEVKILKEPND